MFSSPQFVPTGFSLIVILCWGTSDFLGGFASRRSDAFLVTLLAHAGGFVLMLTLAMANAAAFPPGSSQLWALAAGALGGTGLALFYRALSMGNMGLVAPVAAILGAAIPTGFGMITQGVPELPTIAGFGLAILGIWLICRTDAEAELGGLGLALLAGLGFAGFFLCINQATSASALWSAVYSRLGSLVVVAPIVLLRRHPLSLQRRSAMIGVLAGCIDSTGTWLFIRADQTGRLDAAVMLTSLYPAVTVLLAHFILKEHFTRWKAVGIVAALLAVPLIAWQ